VDFDDERAPGALEDPGSAKQSARQALVIDELSRVLRRGFALQIARSATGHDLVLTQRHIRHIGIGHRQCTQGEIESFLEWVDGPVNESDFQGQTGMRALELGEQDPQELRSERRRALDTQVAFQTLGGARAEELIKFRQQPYESRQESITRRSERKPTRRTYDEPRRQTLFQLGDPFGDDRRGNTQFARRGGEAPEAGDFDECGDVLQRIDRLVSTEAPCLPRGNRILFGGEGTLVPGCVQTKAVGDRPVSRHAVGHRVCQRDLEQIEVPAAKQRVALIDQV
jgi:hypothetical protein